MIKWQKLASDDQGEWAPPGNIVTKKTATVYRHPKKERYRLEVHRSSGSNQGYYEVHWETDRTYSAASLDELMRAAIEGELDASPADSAIRAAIRNAIVEAEDAEDDSEADEVA